MLSAVELLAVTKAVTTKLASEAREGVTPGEYNLSFDAHIEGVIRVGEDYEQRQVNKAKPWSLVYVLLQEVNTLRSAAGQAGLDLNKLVTMAEAVDETLVKQAQKDAESQAATIKAATVTTCKGKVTTELAVTPLANG
jgi:hypothetical protein